MNVKKSESKVLIMGLDNSGKTSILIALKKNTNLMSYMMIKPTRGIETTDFEEQDSYNLFSSLAYLSPNNCNFSSVRQK